MDFIQTFLLNFYKNSNSADNHMTTNKPTKPKASDKDLSLLYFQIIFRLNTIVIYLNLCGPDTSLPSGKATQV